MTELPLYGIWVKEKGLEAYWWYTGYRAWFTPSLRVARAQVVTTLGISYSEGTSLTICALNYDGLPVALPPDLEIQQQRARRER